jgi:hypothetical protein
MDIMYTIIITFLITHSIWSGIIAGGFIKIMRNAFRIRRSIRLTDLWHTIGHLIVSIICASLLFFNEHFIYEYTSTLLIIIAGIGIILLSSTHMLLVDYKGCKNQCSVGDDEDFYHG